MIEVDLNYAKEHLEELIEKDIVVINSKNKKVVLLPFRDNDKKTFDKYVGFLENVDIKDERYKRSKNGKKRFNYRKCMGAVFKKSD